MNNMDLTGLLEKLGLTEYESKTLSTLFKLKEADAPALSRLAQVPKTRVYDVLDKLIKKKLIIEIHGRPKRYRVVDSSEAITLLVKNKKEEVQALEVMAEQIKKSIVDSGFSSDEQGEHVMKVKDKQDFEKILVQELEKAKKDVIGFTEFEIENQVMKSLLEKAKAKDFSVKLIHSTPIEMIKQYAKTGLNMRQFEHGLNAFIIDNKKVILALSDFKKDKAEYHFTIWYDNKPIVNALKHYFDRCWQQGKKYS